MQQVDLYFGLGSRYSYLAFTQIARIEVRFGCRFALLPISSVELMALRGSSPFDGTPKSGQYDWDYRTKDAEAWADYYGVPFVEPKPLPRDHRLMARACHTAGLQEALRPYSKAMFRAVFVDGDEINEAACVAIAKDLKLNPKRFAADFASSLVDKRVTSAAHEALDRGAFGVPTFFVRDKMFWGNDRLALVERAIACDTGS